MHASRLCDSDLVFASQMHMATDTADGQPVEGERCCFEVLVIGGVDQCLGGHIELPQFIPIAFRATPDKCFDTVQSCASFRHFCQSGRNRTWPTP